MLCRNIELILYDIEEVYNSIEISKKLGFDYAYIYHDKDLKDDLSDFKKAHYHFQVYAKNQKEIDKWCEIFSINSARVQKIENKIKAIRYLIHADNNEKYQYELINLNSSFSVLKYFDKLINDESCEIDLIFTYIYYQKKYVSTKELIDYVLENNIWSTFRRNYSIIRDLIIEHNLLFTKSK